jgi:hypothetical protein
MFSLLDNSERMFVIFISENSSIVNARILSNNASEINSKLTFFTGIEPVFKMIYFFFTN